MNWVKALTRFGRLTFLLLMIGQCLLLASFPAKYRNNSTWYAFLVFIVPALGLSWWWITSREEKIRRLFYVWLSYVWFGLVPMVVIVFALIAEKMDRNQAFDSNILKISLGITPVLLLLLLNSGADPRYRKVLTELSFAMTVDLFDGNELLRTVIDVNNANASGQFGVPRSFVKALLSFACITFLLSPVEMIGKLFLLYRDEKDCFQCLNGGLQVCLNLTVLGLRLGIFLGYRWDASMFIAKNIIMICARSLACVPAFRDGEGERRDEEEHRQIARPPPTAPPAAQDTD